MTAAWRSALAAAVVAAVGGVALWATTDGFRALTSEQARRVAVARQPRALPALVLEAADGARLRLDALDGRPALVGFVYTRCATACPLLTMRFRRFQDALARGELPGDLLLLTVTFDPERDTRDRLLAHARAMGAEPSRWRFLRPLDRQGLTALERVFSLVVIPDGAGGFVHNSAIHVIDRRGRLARILAPDSPPAAIADALGAS